MSGNESATHELALTGTRSIALKVNPFDEGLQHRNIIPYDAIYRDLALAIVKSVQNEIKDVELIHIGSTAIPDLRGKPMLDFAAVTNRQDLRAEQKEFEKIGFHRRDVWVDRDDKPYVCGSVTHNQRVFNINIHICHRNDPVHKDSLAFIDILTRRPDLRRRYEEAKDRAHAIDPANPEVYNRAKEAVIEEIHGQLSESKGSA